MKSICLPFLRIAALFQTHLYNDHFPSVVADDIENEYNYLCSYLAIHSSENKTGVIYPYYSCINPKYLVETWLIEISRFAESSIHTTKVSLFIVVYLYINLLIL